MPRASFPELKSSLPPREYHQVSTPDSKPEAALGSEAWEEKRDQLINDIVQAAKKGEFNHVPDWEDEGSYYDDSAELAVVMSRYSIKDGLRLLRALPQKDPEITRQNIAQLIALWDRSQSLDSRGKDGLVGRRILSVLEGEGGAISASVRTFVQEMQTGDPDRAVNALYDTLTTRNARLASSRALYGSGPALVDLSQDSDVKHVLKSLVIAAGDRERSRGIQASERTKPWEDRIAQLYTPYFAGELDAGRSVRSLEESPQYPFATRALDFLVRHQKLEQEQPYYLGSIKDLVYKERFGIRPRERLQEDDRVVVDRYTGKQLPIQEAVQEILVEARKAYRAGQLSREAREGLNSLFDQLDTSATIPKEDAQEALKALGIDLEALDIRVKLRQAEVRRLDIVLKLEAKGLRVGLEQEIAKQMKILEDIIVSKALHKIERAEDLLLELQAIETSLVRVEKEGALEGVREYVRVRPLSFPEAFSNGKQAEDSLMRRTITRLRKLGVKDPRSAVEAFPAKLEHFSREEVYELVKELFPVNGEAIVARDRSERAAYEPTPHKMQSQESFFQPRDENQGLDGDPRDPRPIELATFSQSINAILVTGVYQSKKSGSGPWERGAATLPEKEREDLHHTTVIAKVPASLGMCLPIPLLGSFQGRVVGIRANGSQAPVETEVDAMGRVIVKSFAPDTKDIAYSMHVPTLIPSVDAKPRGVYEAWYTERLASLKDKRRQDEALKALPTDCIPFIESIRALPPADRVRAIETYARSLGYYDFQNGETKGNRVNTDLKTRWRLMRERMQELKTRYPKNTALQHRKIAGVCVDFQELVSGLLNASGFIAGKISGLHVHDADRALSKDSHALAYVEWPHARGAIDLIPVDGTPSGTTLEEEEDIQKIRTPSQHERSLAYDAHAFETEMEARITRDEVRQKHLTERAIQNLRAAFLDDKASAAIEETSSVVASPVWRERLMSYIGEVLTAKELETVQKTLSWMAYSGVLRSFTHDSLPTAVSIVQQESLPIANSASSVMKDKEQQASAVLRDWGVIVNACRKQRLPLSVVGTVLEKGLPKQNTSSKQLRVVKYLVKGFQD